MTTLEKVQRLEQYLLVNNSSIDPVLDLSLNKLLAREFTRTQELKKHLSNQLKTFEENYSIKSTDFYNRYERGEMGDELDFVEWAATVEMLTNLDKRLTLLQIGSDS